MKKTKKSPKSTVTLRTWILFAIFIVVSIYCLKSIITAQQTYGSASAPVSQTVNK